MATKGYATESAVRPTPYGEVTARVAKTLIVEVQAEGIEMDSDVTEVHIYLNGRKFSTMHPERARRFGLTHRKDSW